MNETVVDDALVGITNVMVVDFGSDAEVDITSELSFSCVVVGGAVVVEVNLVVVMRTGVALEVPQYWSPL